MFGLVCVDVLILLLWTFLDRPRGISYLSSAGGLYKPVLFTACSTDLSSPFERAMVAWKAILLGAGVYKSICTWDMPSDIAEVIQLSMSAALYIYTNNAMHCTALQCNALHFISTLLMSDILQTKNQTLSLHMSDYATRFAVSTYLRTFKILQSHYIPNSNTN